MATVTFSRTGATITGSAPGSLNIVFVARANAAFTDPWYAPGAPRVGDGGITFTVPLDGGSWWGRWITENPDPLAGGIEMGGPVFFAVSDPDTEDRHSPANIVRQLIVDLGLATDPLSGGSPPGSWPASADGELTRPDEVITLTDTAARTGGGRLMFTGEVLEHPGIQLRVRSLVPKRGYEKIRKIALAMDRAVYWNIVTLNNPDGSGTTSYVVQSISRSSGVLPLGKGESSKNSLFTINALVDYEKL